MPLQPLSVLAPAKINLYLHVTGRRADGYHTLDSLIAFADCGDRLTLTPAADFSFTLQGPFAGSFTAAERDAGPRGRNLVVRAAHALAALVQRPLGARVTLVKNLPLASGLGGGSADAAAVLWALLEAWELHPASVPGLEDLMMKLGADVPACFSCQPARMAGAGEILEPVAGLVEAPLVLVNPAKLCPTPQVFSRFAPPFREAEPDASPPGDFEGLIEFLRARENMLTLAAVGLVPEIAFALDALGLQPGCRLARMSGSGATCFGLFDDEEAALIAAENILLKHPSWWVRAGTLNRPQRY